MASGAALVKFFLFISNLVFALGGLTILGIGIAFRLALTSITDQLNGKLNVAPWLFITVGSLVFIIAFFGCCGAVRESHCMVVTYTVTLSVIILMQVVLTVLVFINTSGSDLKDGINSVLVRNFEQAIGTSTEKRENYSALEIKLSCCGTTGPDSYGHLAIPSSCCGDMTSACSSTAAFQQGCVQAITDDINPRLRAAGSVALVIAAIEIVSVVFGCRLAGSIKRNYS